DERWIGWRGGEANLAAAPLRAAMASLTVGIDKQLAAGDHVGIGFGERRNRSTDARDLVGFDRIPGIDAAHLELIASAARRSERRDSRILRDAVGQHDQAESTGGA